jgi:proteasome lid subunit RPN8/RPN11
MTIHLKPEQEQLIGRAIEAGLIQGPDDVLDVGVEAIRKRLEERAALRKPMDAEQWSREFHAWVHSHSTATPLLSDEAISRDSIYGTRGM